MFNARNLVAAAAITASLAGFGMTTANAAPSATAKAKNTATASKKTTTKKPAAKKAKRVKRVTKTTKPAVVVTTKKP